MRAWLAAGLALIALLMPVLDNAQEAMAFFSRKR